MSREAIPSPSLFNDRIDFFRQLGIIGFTDESLQEYMLTKNDNYGNYRIN